MGLHERLTLWGSAVISRLILIVESMVALPLAILLLGAQASAQEPQTARSGPVSDERVMEYLPADIDLSIGGGRSPRDAPPDVALWGIEFEAMKRRMVALEERVEDLEALAIQQQEIIQQLQSRSSR